MKEIKLAQFTGPLDLLLNLINEQKLSITEIALSQVTEQYFNYLNKLEENRPEELADFLVIATKLVYLKSRQLIPQLTPEEDEGLSLAEQLKMYKRYLDAGKVLESMWTNGLLGYGRIEPPIKPDGFILPVNAKLDDLKNTFNQLLKRLKPIRPLPQALIDRAVTVKDRIDTIYNLLKTKRRLNFNDLLSGSLNRTEIIVSFLAVLELVKAGSAAVKQVSSFSDLEILKI